MNKITMLSVVAATLLFTGCGEEEKKTASEATTKAVESTKEVASHTADVVKDLTDKAVVAAKEAEAKAEKSVEKAVEATKEAATATKEAAVEAVESAEKSVDTAVEATKEAAVKAVDKAEKAADDAVDTVMTKAGKEAYAKCAGCHGADGKTKALGKSPEIAGQSKEELITKMNGYKAGTIDVAGMGTLMKGQVASMNDGTIKAVATYISTLK